MKNCASWLGDCVRRTLAIDAGANTFSGPVRRLSDDTAAASEDLEVEARVTVSYVLER